MSRAAVSKNGKQYDISGLELTDPQVVQVLEAAEKDGTDLVDYVTRAVGIGVRALQATNVSLGVEALTDEITRTRGAMSEASKQWAREIEDKVKALAGDEGTLAKSIEGLLEDFSEELTNLTGGENSPIREGIKKQIADMASKLIGDFSRETKKQNEEIAELLDPKNAKSPLREIVSKLENLDTGLKGVKEQMVDKATRSDALDNTAASGAPYEEQVVNNIKKIAALASDLCTSTGNIEGLVKKSKKGDAVIELKQGDRSVARVVIEAKNRNLTMPKWHEEISGAKDNRGAIAFLGFCRDIDDMPNSGRIMMIDRLTWLVAYNPDVDSPELLLIVYQMIKTNTLVAAGNLTDDKVAEINTILDDVLIELRALELTARDARAVANAADKLASALGSAHSALIAKIRSIQVSLSPEIRPLEIDGGDVTLAIGQ